MKTKLIPFNAEKAKNGAKVVTRNGLPAKILDYPVKNEDCPILGLILIEGKEFPKLFTKNGNHYSDCTESRLDLFIEEEEVEEDDSDYDPYKEVVVSIMDMVERCSPNNVGSLQDFYNNVKVKCREAIGYDNTWCKKQDEKPVDNKPKFKVGNWIVQESVGVYKVTEIWDSWYEVIDSHELHYSIGFDQEYMCHLWTIQDAKPGDVLHAIGQHTYCIFIFNRLDNDVSDRDRVFATGYCCLDITADKMEFCVQGPDSIEVSDVNVKPATKIQGGLLFQKMKEAGYDWFPNIKEIHKIGKEEVETRRMTHQELADWLRDAPEEHREYRYAGDKDVYNTYDYPETEAKTPVDENRITIRRNHGEWQKPLIEE